jgi:hypothetical protein
MSGRSAIGWFMLSEADRAASARLLEQSEAEGTRDELGFGVIHFAYSDRFFPGTSVQHGRLRYVFFLAWTYRELLGASAGRNFSKSALEDIERRTAGKLIGSIAPLQNSGIAGWHRYSAKRDPVVLASQIYWNALKIWNLLLPTERTGSPPTQSELHRLWPALLAYDNAGDDRKPAKVAVFDEAIPKEAAGWTKTSAKLDFTLTREEAGYIKRNWRSIRLAGETGPPLLSRLADAGVHGVSMWDPQVLRLTEAEELAALRRARLAASLVCIGRAIHAALVERERNKDLKTKDTFHADALEVIRKAHRARAIVLDLKLLRVDVKMEADLFALLGNIQLWADKGGSIQPLFEEIRKRECELKLDLAYLISAERREDWRKDRALPLEYRWPIVNRLLGDLAKAA